MPSHNFSLDDPKNTLRVLLALTIKNGGELRIKGSFFDSLDRGRLLLIDFDAKRNEIILRATSDFGRAVAVHPESYSWVKPASEAPTERARLQAEAEVERRSIPSDEQLAELEERLARKQTLVQHSKDGTATPPLFRTVPPSKPQ